MTGAVLLGLIATPIAPVAKDIASAIGHSVQSDSGLEGLDDAAIGFLVRAPILLATRSSSQVLDADRPGFTGDLMPELLAAIQGRDVFFATHGSK